MSNCRKEVPGNVFVVIVLRLSENEIKLQCLTNTLVIKCYVISTQF